MAIRKYYSLSFCAKRTERNGALLGFARTRSRLIRLRREESAAISDEEWALAKWIAAGAGAKELASRARAILASAI